MAKIFGVDVDREDVSTYSNADVPDAGKAPEQDYYGTFMEKNAANIFGHVVEAGTTAAGVYQTVKAKSETGSLKEEYEKAEADRNAAASQIPAAEAAVSAAGRGVELIGETDSALVGTPVEEEKVKVLESALADIKRIKNMAMSGMNNYDYSAKLDAVARKYIARAPWAEGQIRAAIDNSSGGALTGGGSSRGGGSGLSWNEKQAATDAQQFDEAQVNGMKEDLKSIGVSPHGMAFEEVKLNWWINKNQIDARINEVVAGNRAADYMKTFNMKEAATKADAEALKLKQAEVDKGAMASANLWVQQVMTPAGLVGKPTGFADDRAKGTKIPSTIDLLYADDPQGAAVLHASVGRLDSGDLKPEETLLWGQFYLKAKSVLPSMIMSQYGDQVSAKTLGEIDDYFGKRMDNQIKSLTLKAEMRDAQLQRDSRVRAEKVAKIEGEVKILEAQKKQEDLKWFASLPTPVKNTIRFVGELGPAAGNFLSMNNANVLSTLEYGYAASLRFNPVIGKATNPAVVFDRSALDGSNPHKINEFTVDNYTALFKDLGKGVSNTTPQFNAVQANSAASFSQHLRNVASGSFDQQGVATGVYHKTLAQFADKDFQVGLVDAVNKGYVSSSEVVPALAQTLEKSLSYLGNQVASRTNGIGPFKWNAEPVALDTTTGLWRNERGQVLPPNGQKEMEAILPYRNIKATLSFMREQFKDEKVNITTKDGKTKSVLMADLFEESVLRGLPKILVWDGSFSTGIPEEMVGWDTNSDAMSGVKESKPSSKSTSAGTEDNTRTDAESSMVLGESAPFRFGPASSVFDPEKAALGILGSLSGAAKAGKKLMQSEGGKPVDFIGGFVNSDFAKGSRDFWNAGEKDRARAGKVLREIARGSTRDLREIDWDKE